MPIPVEVPSGPVTVSEDENTLAEEFVAKIAQITQYGTTGAQTVTPPTLIQSAPNAQVGPLSLATPQQQEFVRQIGLAWALSVVPQQGPSDQYARSAAAEAHAAADAAAFMANQAASSASAAAATAGEAVADAAAASASADQAILDAAAAASSASTALSEALAAASSIDGILSDVATAVDTSNQALSEVGAATEAAAEAASQAFAAQTTANGKNKIFYAATPPTATATDDLWIDTAHGFELHRWTGSIWESVQDTAIASAQSSAGTAVSTANAAQATADGKNTIFYWASPPTALAVGDLWIDTSNGYELFRWDGNSWDSVQDQAIADAVATADAAASAAATALTTVDGKNRVFASSTTPSATAVGDLWINTSSGNRLYRWNGASWASVQDAAIAAAQTTADEKNAFTVSATPPSGPAIDDLWFSSDTTTNCPDANCKGHTLTGQTPNVGSYPHRKLFWPHRYTGTGWVDVAGTQSIVAGDLVAGSVTAAAIAAGTITASQISSQTITASQIASGTITASQIAAGTITASQIAGSTITASQIASATITASQIAAGTITASQIASRTITADRIVAGAITANEIASATITASQLAAGSVTASQLAADSVTAKHLTLVDFTNICVNPNGDQYDAVTLDASGCADLDSAPKADFDNSLPTGARGLKQVVRDGYIGPLFPVNPGDQFFVASDHYTSACNYDSTVGIAFFSAGAGTELAWVDCGTATALTAGKQSISGSATAPANSRYARVWAQIDGSSGFGTNYFRNVFVRRRANSDLIVDGAIIADKISTGAVTATKLGAGSVTTESLVAGSITAGKLVVVNFDNLIPNPTSEDTVTDSVSAAWVLDVGSAAYSGTKVRRLTTDGSGNAAGYLTGPDIGGSRIQCSPGDTFYLEAQTRRVTGSGGTLRVGMKFTDSAGTAVGWGTMTPVTGGTTWQKAYTTGAAPAGTISVAFYIEGTGLPAALDIYFDALYARRMGGAELIIDGSIIASKLAADSVTATQLAANSVVASKLVVANFDNLIPNPTSEATVPAGSVEAAGVVDIGASAYSGTKVRQLYGYDDASFYLPLAGRGSGGPDIPATAGDQFYFEAQDRITVGSSGAGYLYIAFHNAAGSVLAYHYSVANGYTTWTKLSVSSPAAPTNTVGVIFGLRTYATQEAECTSQADALYARRMDAGELIVDGAIVATKIAAGAVTAAKISADALATSDFAESYNSTRKLMEPSQGVKLVASSNFATWLPNTSYSLGNIRRNGNNLYVCTQAGTSAGSGGPTGQDFYNEVTDYGARWKYYPQQRVGSGGLQVGRYNLNDALLMAMTAIARSGFASSDVAWYRGNDNPGVSGGAPRLYDPPWVQSTTYSVGDRVAGDPSPAGYPVHNNRDGTTGAAQRIYVCTRNGTSAASGNGPTGTGTGIADNGAPGPLWDYVETVATAERMTCQTWQVINSYSYSFDFTLQPRHLNDNYDALRYLSVIMCDSAGTAFGGRSCFYLPLGDRLYYAATSHTDTANAVRASCTLENATAYRAASGGYPYNQYLRLVLYNAQGPSASRDFSFANLTTSPATATATTLAGASGGGGGGGGDDGGGGGYCVAPDTGVLMADGHYRPAWLLRAGDRIWTIPAGPADCSKGPGEYMVTNAEVFDVPERLTLSLEGGARLTCSPKHLIETPSGFRSAGTLLAGERVPTLDGERRVLYVTPGPRGKVVRLSTSGASYITDGGVLSHNRKPY